LRQAPQWEMRGLLFVGACLFGTVCGAEEPVTNSATDGNAALTTTLKWDELLPVQERTGRTAEPPPPVHDYLSGESGPAAKQQVADVAVNTALDGRRIRLPGFIVPLEWDPSGRVSEFLLVPYVGACIHVPPPPPNQIVYVVLRTPFPMGSLYLPVWVTGLMQVSTTRSSLAVTAYTVRADDVRAYEQSDHAAADGKVH
jgi:uncharacterized protein